MNHFDMQQSNTCTAIQARIDEILVYFENYSFVSTEWFWFNDDGVWFIDIELNSCG